MRFSQIHRIMHVHTMKKVITGTQIGAHYCRITYHFDNSGIRYYGYALLRAMFPSFHFRGKPIISHMFISLQN